MKKLISITLVAFFFFGCQGTDTLEKRISILEKSIVEKEKQINGLTELAFSNMELASGIDSTVSLALPKHFSDYNLNSISVCKAKCLTKLRIKMNICRHVAPQNRASCENSAFAGYSNCLGDCK